MNGKWTFGEEESTLRKISNFISGTLKILSLIVCIILSFTYPTIGGLSFLYFVIPTFIRKDERAIHAKNNNICTTVSMFFFIIYIVFCVFSIQLSLWNQYGCASIILLLYTVFLINTNKAKVNYAHKFYRKNKYDEYNNENIDEFIKNNINEEFVEILSKIDYMCHQVFKKYYLENKTQIQISEEMNTTDSSIRVYLDKVRSIHFYARHIKKFPK